jgi:hypothetical protein
MRLTVGEIFHLGELSKDCAEDRRYEFMFVGLAVPINGDSCGPRLAVN